LYTFAESTVRSCEPCGTNLIPFRLSTGPNIGDPIHFSLYCNTWTGQVSFKTPTGTYRVANIYPSTRKFGIKVKYAGYDRISRGILQLNKPMPFDVTRWLMTEVKDEVEIISQAVVYPRIGLQGLAKFNLQSAWLGARTLI
jgi:hypothetical protein